MNEAVITRKGRAPFALTPRRILLLLLGVGYGVLWIGGIDQYALVRSTNESGPLAALFLFSAGLLVLVGTRSWEERLLLIGIAVLGFVAEVIGVHSKFPFGSYSYTNALGPKLLGVPLAMTCAWMTLVAYVKQIFRQTNLSQWWTTILSAAYLTAFDLLIDPLAANQLGYWHWSHRGIYFGVPLTNFAGWFIVSLIAMALLRKNFEASRTVSLTGLSIIIFFTLLTFLIGNPIIALIGIAHCCFSIFNYAKSSRSIITGL